MSSTLYEGPPLESYTNDDSRSYTSGVIAERCSFCKGKREVALMHTVATSCGQVKRKAYVTCPNCHGTGYITLFVRDTINK